MGHSMHKSRIYNDNLQFSSGIVHLKCKKGKNGLIYPTKPQKELNFLLLLKLLRTLRQISRSKKSKQSVCWWKEKKNKQKKSNCKDSKILMLINDKIEKKGNHFSRVPGTEKKNTTYHYHNYELHNMTTFLAKTPSIGVRRDCDPPF